LSLRGRREGINEGCGCASKFMQVHICECEGGVKFDYEDAVGLRGVDCGHGGVSALNGCWVWRQNASKEGAHGKGAGVCLAR
jgi:hypothetical protein